MYVHVRYRRIVAKNLKGSSFSKRIKTHMLFAHLLLVNRISYEIGRKELKLGRGAYSRMRIMKRSHLNGGRKCKRGKQTEPIFK